MQIKPAIVTDCRSEEGITVGLIDSLIAVARIAAKRPLDSPAIQEALQDLASDEDIKFLLNPSHEAKRD